jgi:predicted outer membrane repeat protein
MDCAVDCSPGCSPNLANCLFVRNAGMYGGGILIHAGFLWVDGCEFRENTAMGGGGAIFGYSAVAEITSCEFTHNSGEAAGAIYFEEGGQVSICDCLFADNGAVRHAGAIRLFIGVRATIARSTFVRNSVPGGGGALSSGKCSYTSVSECTFWGNAGRAAIIAGYMEVILDNTVIAFSTQGCAIDSPYDNALLTCCDLYGNAGGDWVGTIADQFGVRGNICEDPLFCDPENGDFSLDAASPCAPFSAPNPECDLIGAWPVGCGGTAVSASSWGAIKAVFR